MSNTTIKTILARQIIDCKCRPIVEVEVITAGGAVGCGCSPTGSSVGIHEAFILRDNDPAEYNGMGVRQAVDKVKQVIAPALIGLDVRDQQQLDQIMCQLDGTENKSSLGGNAIYSTSIACFRAAAASAGLPLYEYIAGGAEQIRQVPVPCFNMINGGRHASHTMPFNESIVVPYRAADINEAVEIAVKIYAMLKQVIADRFQIEPAIGGSYGWLAPTEDPEVNLELLAEAAERCGCRDKVAFAFDCAASEMYDKEQHTYYLRGRRVEAAEQIEYVRGLTQRWPLVFVEDLLDEDDWDGFAAAHRAIDRTLLLGDDVTVTNRERIRRAIDEGSLDGFILKPNQVGTISEALSAHELARANGLIATPSGRSGGVLNDVVMDLGVGLQTPFQKNGCPKSGERIEKLNFLMRVCDTHPGCRLSDITPLLKF